MNNVWERQGVISVGHRMQVPVVDVMSDRWRIHYSTRDGNNRSIPLWVDVEPGSCEIMGRSLSQTVALGLRGKFDQSGVMPTSILSVGCLKYIYYVGWTRGVDVPHHNATGCAISVDGGFTYEKAQGPIIAQSSADPYFTGTLYALSMPDGIHGWYMSCLGWDDAPKGPRARYCLKHATSHDRLHWVPGATAIPLDENEGGICQASVMTTSDGLHRMWYSYRGRDTEPAHSYRIGYATSRDAHAWTRRDADFNLVGRLCSSFDDEMQAYPYVIQYQDELYMFYNGNDFGGTGIMWCTTRV